MEKISEVKGQYRVGTCIFEVKDSNRVDVNGKKQAIRRLPVRVFYPTNDTSGKSKPYLENSKAAESIAKVYRCKEMMNPELFTDCYINANVADGTFPVVFFNHGYNGFLEQNTVFCSDLASDGYIVISVSHPSETNAVEYEDGTVEFYQKNLQGKIVKPMFSGFMAQNKVLKSKREAAQVVEEFEAFQQKYCQFLMERAKEWELDTMAVYQFLKEGTNGLPIKNSMKLDKVAATGHSFGGSVAFRLLEQPEFVCGVNMDGAVFGDHNGKDFKKPTLTLCCKQNLNVELGGAYGNSADSYIAMFENMSHLGFTDLKFFPASKMLVGKADSTMIRKAITSYHEAFLNAYLLHDEKKPDFCEIDGIEIEENPFHHAK